MSYKAAIKFLQIYGFNFEIPNKFSNFVNNFKI